VHRKQQQQTPQPNQQLIENLLAPLLIKNYKEPYRFSIQTFSNLRGGLGYKKHKTADRPRRGRREQGLRFLRASRLCVSRKSNSCTQKSA
ncbi:MAG: hypothetical protein ACK51W_02895, partial [Aphanizomenon sp.]